MQEDLRQLKKLKSMFLLRSSLFLRVIYMVSLIALLFSSGCGVTRITSTEKSAVEQALVAEALKGAVEAFVLPDLSNQKFYLEGEAADKQYRLAEYGSDLIEQLVLNQLLNKGMLRTLQEQEAELFVDIAVDFANVDDGSMVIGIPSLPIAVGSNSISTPEIALLGVKKQFGRARVLLTIVDQKGHLIYSSHSPVSERRYHRWSFLIFFGWRVTDLPEPF